MIGVAKTFAVLIGCSVWRSKKNVARYAIWSKIYEGKESLSLCLLICVFI